MYIYTQSNTRVVSLFLFVEIANNTDMTELDFTELKKTLVTTTEQHTLFFHTTRRRKEDGGWSAIVCKYLGRSLGG
jgi:hypothetical protein